MQTLSVATTENWPTCLGHYRRRGDTLLTSAADRSRTPAHYDTNGTTWATTYAYDGDNRPTATTLANGKTVTNTYDALGRITRKRLAINSNYDTTYTYLAGANNSQTALLASYQNGSDTAYTYTYDDNGNITRIQQGTLSAAYTYDAANQLIREDNGFINQTVTYTYDAWGNILTKSEYPYTTGTLGTPSDTVVYTYTNSAWGDQLTSYNGETISYDAMGNPVSYRGYTTSFEGKQLVSAVKTGKNITFAYDENGLRTQKTVNNVTTNYYYNGSVLMSLTQGDTSLLFSYDAAGNVVAVEVQSDSWLIDGETLYYIRNGQGDITGLINSSGRTVIEYRYDTWGKDCSLLPDYQEYLELQELNPFRYRGYVYDTETGWYYLQSRYYDPATCRFISADILLSTGQGVLGHNTFAYCGNNPISRIDLNGYDWEDFWEWLKSIFSGGDSSCSGETQTADEVKTVEIVLTFVPDTPPSTPEPTPMYPEPIQTLLDVAASYDGTPYGTDEGELDCSAYVQAVYASIGIELKRTSHKQLDYAREHMTLIPINNNDLSCLRAGDIIFYEDVDCGCYRKKQVGYDIHHVAIYAGNDEMWDSTLTDEINGVSKRPVNSIVTRDDRVLVIVAIARP